MKKLFLFAVAAVSIAACSKKEIAEEIQGPAPVYDTVIKASAESFTDTKAAYNDVSGAFSWVLGDKFDVFTSAGNKVFTCTNAVESSFSGNLGGAIPGIAAFYPSGKGSLDGKVLTVALPASSAWTESAATPMVAMISDGDCENISFKHLAGAVRIAVTNVPPTATKFVLSTSSRIAGDFTISDCTVDGCEIATDATDSGKEVTLTFPAAGDFTDKTFYVPVPTGDYDYFEVRIKDEWGNTLAGRRYTNDDAGFSIERTDLAGDAVTLDPLEISDAIVLNDTQIGIRWSLSDFATTSAAITADKAPAYTFGIYDASKSGLCDNDSKMWEWSTAANASVFTSTPGHVFSGLEDATTYYIKVRSAATGTAVVKAFTTEPEDPDFILTTAPDEGDVIVHESFNMLCRGAGDPVQLLTGVDLNNWTNEFGNPGVSSNAKLSDCGQDRGLLTNSHESTTSMGYKWLNGSPIHQWTTYYFKDGSRSNNFMTNVQGAVRFGGSNSTGYIVTPSLTCLPAKSTVTVSIKAGNRKATAQKCYLAVFPADATVNSKNAITTTPLAEYDFADIEAGTWGTYEKDIEVPAGARIGIGTEVNGTVYEFYLTDVSIKLKEYAPIDQKLVFANNSQIAVRWSTTRFQTPATDIAKAYTFGVYTDAECESQVYSPLSVTAGSNRFIENECPGFVFSSLTPGTDYYVKVTDVAESSSSIEKYSTTNIYPEARPLRSTAASSEGDVILFEDFNELKFEEEYVAKLSGYWIGSGNYSTGTFTDPDGTHIVLRGGGSFGTTTESAYNLISNAQDGATNAKTWIDGTRSFNLWKYYSTANTRMQGGCGYLRLRTGCFAVSPVITETALSSGATVKVTIVGSKASASAYPFSVVVFPSEATTSGYRVTTDYLEDPSPETIAVNVRNWTSGSCTVHLNPGERIGIGPVGSASYAHWLNEVKVELVSYD